jgi:hypothetical protein
MAKCGMELTWRNSAEKPVVHHDPLLEPTEAGDGERGLAHGHDWQVAYCSKTGLAEERREARVARIGRGSRRSGRGADRGEQLVGAAAASPKNTAGAPLSTA